MDEQPNAAAIVTAADHMTSAINDALMDAGQHFSCTEYESILNVYRALGYDVSELLGPESGHVRGDEEGDDHWTGENA